MQGRKQAFLLVGRKTSPDCLDERIFVAVAALKHRTVARGNGVDPIDTKEPVFPDRDTTFERGFRLRLHFPVAEFRRRLIALGSVAVVTAEHQIAGSIGPSPAARDLVIDLERNIPLVTVGAPMLEFL